MINIIKHGSKHYLATCPHCECKFEYDEIDLKYTYYDWFITCPECGTEHHAICRSDLIYNKLNNE